MSRRPPNPAAERAAKNQQTIKSLLKLEANKVCADCKRNKRKFLLGIRPSVITRPVLIMSHTHRSTMGQLEPRRLYLHPLLGHSPWNGYTHQPCQVRRPRCLDRRAATKCLELGKCSRQQVLGGQAGSGPRPLRIENRELYSHQIRAQEMGNGWPDARSLDTRC